ncbi:hypothetical protein [Bradyrhizobium sp. ORS 111]|uniref:hypothetical protein n=1 Tax=Bradyrhizobium sp. ORS 111 TaxID=1685958 RepID=UPI00388D6C5A
MLVIVTLLSVAIAGLIALLNPSLAPASSQSRKLADLPPVRIIGTPFVPNTNPSVR